MPNLIQLSVDSNVSAVRLGIAGGFIACVAYPLASFVPLPMRATAAIAACFGPALVVACFGLKALLDAGKQTSASALGFLLNALAGALFSAMALVQIAVGSLVKDRTIFLAMNGIWLGLDKAFDIYIGLGTIFFAIRNAAASSLWQGVLYLRAGYRRRPDCGEFLHISSAAGECRLLRSRTGNRSLVPCCHHPDEPFAGVGPPSESRRSARRACGCIPVIGIGYGLAYMDRINLSFASLQMNRDLHFSASVYGFGAGLFFIGYALCEVPSNLLLLRFGAKRWLARIMFTWGLLAAARCLCARHSSSTRCAAAGYGGGGLLSRRDLLPDTVVSGAHASTRSEPLLYRLAAEFGGHGLAGGWLLGLGGKLGLAGWQWLF
jgi:hypothetical protein